MKIFQHENLSYESFLTQKFPDLRYYITVSHLDAECVCVCVCERERERERERLHTSL